MIYVAYYENYNEKAVLSATSGKDHMVNYGASSTLVAEAVANYIDNDTNFAPYIVLHGGVKRQLSGVGKGYGSDFISLIFLLSDLIIQSAAQKILKKI